MAEHLAHLSITTAAYVVAIDRATEDARRRGVVGPGPYRHGRLGAWFVRGMEPPPRMRLKTFGSLVPPRSSPSAEVVADFVATQDDLLASLRRADGLDLGRAKVRSPFVKLLRLSLGQAFAIVLAHNRRHFWLIDRLTESPDFPQARPS